MLPSDLIYLKEPNVESLIEGLEEALNDLKNKRNVCPYECNMRTRSYYNWPNVTSRTELVYKKVLRIERLCLGNLLEKFIKVR